MRKSPEVLSERDELGASPLHHAAAGGYVPLIQFISSVIDSQGRPHLCHPSQDALWHLQNMCYVYQYIVYLYRVCLCTHLPPERDSCDDQGNVPLHWAVEKDKPESCRALLDLGADPNILNTALLSPLHLAVSLGHNNLVEVRTLEVLS